MRIIAVATLKTFWEVPAHRDAEQPLRTWVRVVRAASWPDPPAIKRMFNSVDLLGDGRVVFDIGGNKYRLIVWINFSYGWSMCASSAPVVNMTGSMPGQSERGGVLVRPLRTADDHRGALIEIESLMSAARDSAEGDRLDVLVSLVEAWEARHVPVEAPDPIAAIVFMMEQKGLSRRDLAGDRQPRSGGGDTEPTTRFDVADDPGAEPVARCAGGCAGGGV